MACETHTSDAKSGEAGAHGRPTPPSRGVLARLTQEEQALLFKLLTEPTAFIDNPALDKPGADVRLFGVAPKLRRSGLARFPSFAPVAGGRGCSATRMPTLSSEDERTLFLRLNLARKRIRQLLAAYDRQELPVTAARKLVAWGRWEREIRARIVELNLPLVLAMAKRTRLAGIDYNEMVSEGNMALLRSVDKFDCARGFKFSTYACRAILKSFSRVAMRASRYRGTFPVEFDPAIERSDHLERRREDVEADCVGELKHILLSNMAELTTVERTVITERFALEHTGDEPPVPKTLEQVGQIIGVTKERVRQIQNKALKKIREALEAAYLAA